MTKYGAALLFVFLSGAAAPLPPAQALETISVAYSISFWGMPFGQTSYQGNFTKGGYSVTSHFEASGIVSLFWQAIIDASASGGIGAQKLESKEYDSYYRRGDSKKERVQVTFTNGAVTTFADPPYDTTKYPVSDEDKRQAVDPMSAVTLVLLGVRADGANPCGTVAPVFDGRRRYDIEFSYIKDEPVKLGTLFSGTAHLCQLHYHQIAGFKPKILKEGAAIPPIYGDFADITALGAPNRRYVLPLKLWSRLTFGTVSAELTSLRPATLTPPHDAVGAPG